MPTAIVNVDYRTLKQHRAGGNLKFLGYGCQEPLDNRLGLPPNDARMRPSKTGITKKSGAAWKNLLVGGLDVRVGADHRTDAPVQHAS